MFVLVFLSVCMDSCTCFCISKYLYGLFVLVLIFLSICMDSCVCAVFFSIFTYGLLCLCLYF